jgi:hypothetical protein
MVVKAEGSGQVSYRLLIVSFQWGGGQIKGRFEATGGISKNRIGKYPNPFSGAAIADYPAVERGGRRRMSCSEARSKGKISATFFSGKVACGLPDRERSEGEGTSNAVLSGARQ